MAAAAASAGGLNFSFVFAFLWTAFSVLGMGCFMAVGKGEMAFLEFVIFALYSTAVGLHGVDVRCGGDVLDD